MAAFVAYAALAIIQTYPLIGDLSSRIPKDLGDPLLAASVLWWNATVLPLTRQWWDGFGFFPADGMMAFSAHFLGASLIASPLQWLGATPVAAYNVTLLLSYPLSGIAAYALAWRLARRHDAAAMCGLAYAFNPYRVAHLEHLELLMAFGMPAAMASLHMYAERRELKWLVAFAAAVIVQLLSSSYYGLFFTVLLGLWILWFIQLKEWRAGGAIVVAAGLAASALMPLVAGYARVHADHDLTRDFAEVLNYSGDLTSLVTASPLSTVWGWTSWLNGGERQLFPGLTLVVVAAAAIAFRRRETAGDGAPPPAALSTSCWGLAAGFAAIALWARVAGPTQFELGWLRMSITVFYKPLTLAILFAALAIVFTGAFQDAWRRRSPFTFYVVAAIVLFACSLGPRPTFLGEQFWYEPPYAWLMRLPFFGDTVRVPARFAMLGMLALAVAASLGFNRMSSGRWRTAAFLVVSAGIVADSWMRPPLPPVPRQAFSIPQNVHPAAVLELPLGDLWRDSAALFRATIHHTRTVNGYNGFEPPYYQVLRRALGDRDPTILGALAAHGPLLIAADNHADPQQTWAHFLMGSDGIRPLTAGARWSLFRLPAQPRAEPASPCHGHAVSVVAATDRIGPVDPEVLTDGNPQTRWMTVTAQRAGDELVLDLGRVGSICGVELSMGREAVLYPGALAVAVSIDGIAWQPAFRGRLGGAAFRAALADPSDVRISIPLSVPLRYIRLWVEQPQPDYPWAIADLVVTDSGG